MLAEQAAMSPGVPVQTICPPASPPPRTHVDHVIGVTDKVEVVFDHDNRGALGNESVKHTQQHLNIERMQADRGLVEHEYGIVLHAAHLACKLKSLRLAARDAGVGSPSVR